MARDYKRLLFDPHAYDPAPKPKGVVQGLIDSGVIPMISPSELSISNVLELRSTVARLTDAIKSLESGVGENDQPYRNKHGMMVREVCEADYQRCTRAITERTDDGD